MKFFVETFLLIVRSSNQNCITKCLAILQVIYGFISVDSSKSLYHLLLRYISLYRVDLIDGKGGGFGGCLFLLLLIDLFLTAELDEEHGDQSQNGHLGRKNLDGDDRVISVVYHIDDVSGHEHAEEDPVGYVVDASSANDATKVVANELPRGVATVSV